MAPSSRSTLVRTGSAASRRCSEPRRTRSTSRNSPPSGGLARTTRVRGSRAARSTPFPSRSRANSRSGVESSLRTGRHPSSSTSPRRTRPSDPATATVPASSESGSRESSSTSSGARTQSPICNTRRGRRLRVAVRAIVRLLAETFSTAPDHACNSMHATSATRRTACSSAHRIFRPRLTLESGSHASRSRTMSSTAIA